MKKIIIIVLILILSIYQTVIGKNTESNHGDSLILKIKITNMLPVGWGVQYKAKIIKVIDGNTKEFNDTIIFGLTASKEFNYLNIGDSAFIKLKNSMEINDKSYLPAINGTVSNSSEIWLISKIYNQKYIYTGTAQESNGEAIFIWDFADSEAFNLYGMKLWDKKYLNKKINIEGILIQYIDNKSVIIDWKIIEY